MIIFVKIGDQIEQGSNQFAFYSTATGQFLMFEGEQVWDSVQDFADVAVCADGDDKIYQRCLELIPEDYEPPMQAHSFDHGPAMSQQRKGEIYEKMIHNSHLLAAYDVLLARRGRHHKYELSLINSILNEQWEARANTYGLLVPIRDLNAIVKRVSDHIRTDAEHSKDTIIYINGRQVLLKTNQAESTLKLFRHFECAYRTLLKRDRRQKEATKN